MQVVEYKKVLKDSCGFSYIEIVIALTIISISSIGLIQSSLKQTANIRELYSRFQAQALLSNIQTRLDLNKAYIQEKQHQAVYFKAQLDCINETRDWCQSESCDAARLAELDVMEFTCSAKESGLIHQLTFSLSSSISWANQITASIWRISNHCEAQMCKLVEQRIWL